jgi:23S rRNA pseudouridine1911/1915/1917 synthase
LRTPDFPPAGRLHQRWTALNPPERESLTVTEEQSGRTVASLLRDLAPGTSWSRARDLCRSGRVRVDGAVEGDDARRLTAGSRLELASEPSRRPRGPASPESVIHLDAEVVVVRKPAGLLTVPFERGDRDTLIALARVAVRRIEGSGASPTLRAVQRLDKETSGLVVFARSVAAQRALQQQLTAHTVTRRYLAIAHGEVRAAEHATLFVPDRGDGLRGSWRPARGGRGESQPPPEAKRAVTRVAVVERLRGATLASCELETGRTHQIRIHLAEAGHPLVGETVYVRDYRGPLLPAPRPMLHAAVLGFDHPRTGRRLTFEEPAPEDFERVLAGLRGAG